MQIVGVKFKNDGMTYNFSSEIELKIGDRVIVETERGYQLGIVAKDDVQGAKINKLKPIESIATEKEYDKYLKNLADAKKVLEDTKKLIKEMDINMNLIDASFSLDRKLLLFNFISDERVDFRELVRTLASIYHMRIELHQVGVRDKAKFIGGIGLCGREQCCSSNINSVSSVNISMVKNQNIALNPTKINGACGRLLCCFNYENETYEENREKLPKIGEKIDYKGKSCEVVELDVLRKKYKIKTSENTYEEVTIDD